MHSLIIRCVNSITLDLGRAQLTWWHRADSSIGKLEVRRNCNFIHGQLWAWGYGVSVEIYDLRDLGTDYSRAIVNRHIKHLDYRCSPRLRGAKRGTLLERVLVFGIEWLLSKHAVQAAIAGAFENNATPLCQTLRRAVRSAVDDSEILDESRVAQIVEDALGDFQRNFEVSADDVVSLDSAVRGIIDDEDTMRDIVDGVAEEMARRMRGES